MFNHINQLEKLDLCRCNLFQTLAVEVYTWIKQLKGVWRQKTRYGWAAVAPGHVQCAKMARPGTCAATVVYYIFAR
jgi:hypothetical protein